MIITSVRGAALTSVDAALAFLLDGIEPIVPTRAPVATAMGAVVATALQSRDGLPAVAEAAIDGYAVRALDLVGASAYAPVPVSAPLIFVESGDPLPPGTDSVIDPLGVDETSSLAQVQTDVMPGEGVRARGADVAPGGAIVEAGRVLRPVDALIARRAGVEAFVVRRPRLRLIDIGANGHGSTATFLVEAAIADGADVERRSVANDLQAIQSALDDAAADVIVLIGGTGRARRDVTAQALAARGILLAHGIAQQPGRTSAVGLLGAVPVIALPGAPDEALAAYWTLVQPVLDRLSGRAPQDGDTRPLVRKIASSVGMCEIALLAASPMGWIPLAVGALPLSSLAHASAWAPIAADSEGAAEGTLLKGFPLA